jgi:hypothetical protein
MGDLLIIPIMGVLLILYHFDKGVKQRFRN